MIVDDLKSFPNSFTVSSTVATALYCYCLAYFYFTIYFDDVVSSPLGLLILLVLVFKAHGPESDIDALCVGPCIATLQVGIVLSVSCLYSDLILFGVPTQ